MNQPAGLLSHRLYQRLIIMPQDIDRNAAQKIDILLAIVIPGIYPIAMVENNLIAVKDRKIIILIFRKNKLISFFHNSILLI